jgi:hypothetical protein
VVEKIPESEDDFQKKREMVLKMSELWGTFVGSPVGQQSLKFFWLEECIEGGELRPIHIDCQSLSRDSTGCFASCMILILAQRISFAPAHTKRSFRKSQDQHFQMPP